jgi:hypothetical protein
MHYSRSDAFVHYSFARIYVRINKIALQYNGNRGKSFFVPAMLANNIYLSSHAGFADS